MHAVIPKERTILSETNEREYNEQKFNKFKNMQIGGIVLTAAGVSALATGIAMISSAGTASYQVTYSNGNRTESGDPVGGFGAIIAGLGVPMTAGGIVLTTIGGKKKTEYRNKLARVEIECGLDRITLVYNF